MSSPSSTDIPLPRSFDARDFRQPAVFVRVDVRSEQPSARTTRDLPAEYQGLLLEALNARAIVPRDLTVVGQREALDQRAAAVRAREVGADYALLVDVAIATTAAEFCTETRRTFRAQALTVVQRVVVLEARDGGVRWKPDAIEASALEADCTNPKDSRRRSVTETMQAAVDRLLTRLLSR